MVIAILEGKKTMTRRVIKSRHESGLFQINTANHEPDFPGYYHNRSVHSIGWNEENVDKDIFCPYGEVGNILWVRETWRGIDQDFGADRFEYKATEKINLIDKWKPSIFMPKEATRIFLEITDIKVERLQDISFHDAIAEGIEREVDSSGKSWFKNYGGVEFSTSHMFKQEPIASFQSLWGKINGEDSWSANPFVWVITFKRIK